MRVRIFNFYVIPGTTSERVFEANLEFENEIDVIKKIGIEKVIQAFNRQELDQAFEKVKPY